MKLLKLMHIIGGGVMHIGKNSLEFFMFHAIVLGALNAVTPSGWLSRNIILGFGLILMTTCGIGHVWRVLCLRVLKALLLRIDKCIESL